MPDFSMLSTLTSKLHFEFVRLYYLILPVFFALAVVIQWFRTGQGGSGFVDVLRRAIVSTVLLVAFPDICDAILLVTNGLAERIDSLNSLDTVVQMAGSKIEEFTVSPASALLAVDDLLIAVLTFMSFLSVYIARFLNVAMFHFFWTFFMISAPLLMLFNIFASASQITVNLFKGIIEIACWKIVWAILGAMLLSLSFSDVYEVEGSYITIVVLNFVIAIAMLATPLVVKSIVGSGIQSAATTISPVAIAAMAAVPAKAAVAYKLAINGPTKAKNLSKFARHRSKSFRRR